MKLTLTDDEGAQTELSTAITVAAVPVNPPADQGGNSDQGGTPPVTDPVTAPVTTPVVTPVISKPVTKPRCKKRVRSVVRKVHGKRKKVKRIVCVKPVKRAKRH